MSRRRRYSHYSDDSDYQEYRHRRRGSFLYRLQRFIYRTLVTLVCLVAGAVIVLFAFLAYSYRAYLGTVLLVLLGIGGVLIGLLVVKAIIALITAIVNTISAMRVRAIKAGRAKVELSRRKLERDAYRQRLQQSYRQKPAPVPRLSVPLAPSGSLHKPLVRLLPPEEELLKREEPRMRTPVYYQQIQQRVKPGQLVALVRPDGTLRLESWDAFKMLLVLGGSSSGKTSTIAEKILGFVNGGGLLVPCDPHAAKEDSLFNKIAPLRLALYPGATFAVEHYAILQNIRLVNAILEERIDRPGSYVPVLLIVEELNRLLRDKVITKEISRILEALGEEGRGFNVFVVVGCQRVTYLSDIRKSFISFIVHRCDESEAQHVIPGRYAKQCPELPPGHCFVKDSNGATESGLQVLVTRQDMEQASEQLAFEQTRLTIYPQYHLPGQGGTPRLPVRPPNRPIDPRRAARPESQSRPLHRSRLNRCNRIPRIRGKHPHKRRRNQWKR